MLNTIHHQRSLLSIVFAGFIMVGFAACNMNSKEKEQSAISNPGDSLSNTTANTDSASTASSSATAKPAAKTRKGKASIGASAGNANTKMIKDAKGVYTNPEVMPSFPGGEDALSQYIQDHVDYSQPAMDANDTGTVHISFVVDEKGYVSDVKPIGNKVGGGLDEEAARVISQMPKWTPGKVKGKDVKTRLSIPVSFQIQEE